MTSQSLSHDLLIPLQAVRVQIRRCSRPLLINPDGLSYRDQPRKEEV